MLRYLERIYGSARVDRRQASTPITGIMGICLLFGITIDHCQADIYVYVDAEGVRHLTNAPPPGDSRYKRIMDTPNYRAPTAAEAERTQLAQAEAPPLLGHFEPPPTRPAAAEAGWQLYKPQRPSGAEASANRGHYRIIARGRNVPQRRAVATQGRIAPRLSGSGQKPFGIKDAQRLRLRPHVDAIARQHGLDPALLHAVISAESAYNPRALSKAGAMGLMQLMPATAKRFGVQDPYDPVANINGGARYLSWLLNRFGSLDLALAGYNAGEGAVERHGNAIPPYPETQTYVQRVRQFYQHFRSNPHL